MRESPAMQGFLLFRSRRRARRERPNPGHTPIHCPNVAFDERPEPISLFMAAAHHVSVAAGTGRRRLIEGRREPPAQAA
jgi:hypothetical protein